MQLHYRASLQPAERLLQVSSGAVFCKLERSVWRLRHQLKITFGNPRGLHSFSADAVLVVCPRVRIGTLRILTVPATRFDKVTSLHF